MHIVKNFFFLKKKTINSSNLVFFDSKEKKKKFKSKHIYIYIYNILVKKLIKFQIWDIYIHILIKAYVYVRNLIFIKFYKKIIFQINLIEKHIYIYIYINITIKK